MINACGGRFHIIRDSEPKPAQRAALIAEIDKLVWFNDHRFYSVLTQELETEEISQDVHEQNQMLSEKHDNSAETARWILLILLNAAFIFTKITHEHFHFAEILFVLVSFTITIRNILNPDVACSFKFDPILHFHSSRCISMTLQIHDTDTNHNVLVMIFTFPSIVFIAGLGLTVGAAVSIRTWSDVLIACHAAPGVTFGLIYTLLLHYTRSNASSDNSSLCT